MIALIHASNVTGALQPITEVGRIAAEHEAVYLVDAAQSLGQVPIDVRQGHIDLLAAPGHKGLLGPLGTGVLYVSPNAARQIRPVRYGGTGTQSEQDVHPRSLPDGFEAGNHNMPGLAGLRAGVEYVQQNGVDEIRRAERTLVEMFHRVLREVPGVRLLGPRAADQKVGVVSVTVKGFEPQEVAAMLDAAHGVQVRGGLHCAPWAHRALGTLEGGGTVRFSLGPFNSTEHVELASRALAEIAAAATI
jgi:selenocysteine lyase/cysteine desulfurase